MMIALDVADEIKRLLDEGNLSQRRIARQLGVSRGTVHAIARGKRPDYRTRKREREDEFVATGAPWGRCPTCGGMVQMPCLACRVRAIREERRRSAGGTGSLSARESAGNPHGWTSRPWHPILNR
jgi:transcriptional regulator with XRE-family HTH domain